MSDLWNHSEYQRCVRALSGEPGTTLDDIASCSEPASDKETEMETTFDLLHADHLRQLGEGPEPETEAEMSAEEYADYLAAKVSPTVEDVCPLEGMFLSEFDALHRSHMIALGEERPQVEIAAREYDELRRKAALLDQVERELAEEAQARERERREREVRELAEVDRLWPAVAAALGLEP